jgi:hypothetical protein
MRLQNFYFLFIFICSNLIYCQEKNNSQIIKKEIDYGMPIYSTMANEQIKSISASKNYNSKIYVYYSGKFFLSDTLEKIKNIKDYKFEIIKIPDSISKNIHTIIYLKK